MENFKPVWKKHQARFGSTTIYTYRLKKKKKKITEAQGELEHRGSHKLEQENMLWGYYFES